MAVDKMGGMGVLLGFIAALIVFLTSIVAFGVTADVAFTFTQLRKIPYGLTS